MKGRLTKMYSYMYSVSASTRGFLPCYSHFFTSATTARTSQMWLLYAFSYRKACDIRETKFSRRPVEDDHPDSSLIWSSPFLNVLLLKLASGVFYHQTWVFASMDKKRNSTKISTCAENHSLVTKFTNGCSSHQM